MLCRILLVSCLTIPAAAQQPTPAPAPPTPSTPSGTSAPAPTAAKPFVSSELGLTYTPLPAGIQIDMGQSMSGLRSNAESTADSEAEKAGINCVQLPYATSYPSGAVVMLLYMPYSCLGGKLEQIDAAVMGEAMAAGIMKKMDISSHQVATFSTAKNKFSVLRAVGKLKGNSVVTAQLTVDLPCTITEKAFICFMVMAGGPEDLEKLDATRMQFAGDTESPLVPPGTFAAAPAAAK